MRQPPDPAAMKAFSEKFRVTLAGLNSTPKPSFRALVLGDDNETTTMLNPVSIPAMDATDYADTIDYLSDFAEGLELEAMVGNPVDTERLSKAALLLRRTIVLLEHLAQPDREPQF